MNNTFYQCIIGDFESSTVTSNIYQITIKVAPASFSLHESKYSINVTALIVICYLIIIGMVTESHYSYGFNIQPTLEPPIPTQLPQSIRILSKSF